MTKMMPKMGESLAAIRAKNRASPDDDILSRIFRNFRGILGDPSDSKMVPFC